MRLERQVVWANLVQLVSGPKVSQAQSGLDPAGYYEPGAGR